MRAIRHLEHTVSWARAHERHLSALSLAGGFAFDSYAFGRIDRPMTQAVFIIYLIVAGAAIAVLHALESRPDDRKPSGRTRTILVTVAQFALGCLLSGFCVFYIRSAAIGASWPFLLCMAGIFIGNEYLRRYHARLVFSALLFFFSLYSYAILLVPVVIARIGTVPFLMSGAIAVAVFFFYMQTLAVLGHDRYRVARMQIAAGMIGITALINAFYFVKIFPPLPLVLSDAGVYHAIQRAGRDYQVTAEDEPPRWQALFGTFPVEHIQTDDKLYLYSAIFAPYRLTTNIVHRWEWRDPKSGRWTQQQTVRFTIRGGREDGFRAYSSKTAPRPGQWRVNIATADGHAIGRVRFSVETQAVPPAVSVKTLK
jgi:MFS family permease